MMKVLYFRIHPTQPSVFFEINIYPEKSFLDYFENNEVIVIE